MLVLKRREGERILIGNDIVITLVEAWDGQARLGIDAPVDIVVDREEIRKKRDLESRRNQE